MLKALWVKEYRVIKNSASKTHFVATRDRLQHFSNDYYECSGCKNQYHPKVHSQPYVIQFGIILVCIPVYLFIMYKSVVGVYVLSGLFAIYLYFYFKKERKVSAKKLKYGDIILECPECGDTNGAKVP